MNENNTTPSRAPSFLVAAVLSVAIAAGGMAGAGSALLLRSTASTAPSSTAASVTATVSATTLNLEQAITSVSAKAADSVVTIRLGSGSGSGFVVDSKGLIVTSAHVIAAGGALTVVFADGSNLPATVVRTDTQHDVALLSVHATGLPALPLANGAVEIGQTVIAMGTALGEFPNTVTVGVVSGLDRSIDVGVGRAAASLAGVFQTDAALNPGMSGGPLLNVAGQVVGVNTAVAGDAFGIGFAEPINVAAALLSRPTA
jgi:putative serine protease PepD